MLTSDALKRYAKDKCNVDKIGIDNIERFKGMVREFLGTTQFMIITHNKITMDLADAIYGVTMEESGVSKLVSVRFEQAADLVDAV